MVLWLSFGLRDCPFWCIRYHGDWKSETQTVVSLIAFMHWLETGTLVLHNEVEEKLGCKFSFLSIIYPFR